MTTNGRIAAATIASSEDRMARLRALVAMTRPLQLALIVLVLANGMLLGQLRAGVADVSSLVVAVLFVLGAGAAVHLVNEAEDHHTDRLTRRTAFSGGSGALEASGLSPALPRRLGLLLAAAVGVAAPVVSLYGGLPLAATIVLLLGLGGGLLYSLPPAAAMRHGWGEPLNALLGGLLLPLMGVAVVTGSVSMPDAAAFLPFSLVVFASVMATAWPDRRADRLSGKGTMQVRLAPATLRRIHALASVTFVVATIVAAVSGAMPVALLGLAVVPALLLGMATYTRRRSPLPDVAAMVGLALITTVGLVLAGTAGMMA